MLGAGPSDMPPASCILARISRHWKLFGGRDAAIGQLGSRPPPIVFVIVSIASEVAARQGRAQPTSNRSTQAIKPAMGDREGGSMSLALAVGFLVAFCGSSALVGAVEGLPNVSKVQLVFPPISTADMSCPLMCGNHNLPF